MQYDQRARTLSTEHHSFADFENPIVRDAAAAVDPVRVGGGGAAAAPQATGTKFNEFGMKTQLENRLRLIFH